MKLYKKESVISEIEIISLIKWKKHEVIQFWSQRYTFCGQLFLVQYSAFLV